MYFSLGVKVDNYYGVPQKFVKFSTKLKLLSIEGLRIASSH